MPRGGYRNGSGRKTGSPNTRTRQLAEMATADGVTPLEVMLKAMRDHFAAGRYDDAAERAKEAAPYIHPRLASVDFKGEHRIVDISDKPLTAEEWMAAHGATDH